VGRGGDGGGGIHGVGGGEPAQGEEGVWVN
jgi:hypothetical protein